MLGMQALYALAILALLLLAGRWRALGWRGLRRES
jgi:hypothetical protein